MATPTEKAEPAKTPEPQPTGGAEPGKKGTKASKPAKQVHRGEKSARYYAVEFLMKQPGHKAKFGELIKHVSDKLTGGHPEKLTWTPTYYLHSPGFSNPEKGVYAFDPKLEEDARADMKKARAERLAKAGKKAKPAKGEKADKSAGKAKKAKGPKNDVEARRIASAEAMKAKQAEAEKEFDEAAAQKANGGNA